MFRGVRLVVLVNVLVETRLGRRRSLAKEARTPPQDVVLGLKIAGTFASICVLWTIWHAEAHELGSSGARDEPGPRDLAVLIGVRLAMGALGVLLGGRKREVFGAAVRTTEAPGAFWRKSAGVALGAAGFIAVASGRRR